MTEREIKLRFDSPEEARSAIIAAGATPLRARRLQEDCLLDTADGRLRATGLVLRIRRDRGRSLVTLKGPVQPGPMKVREEDETMVGDGDVLLKVFEELGLQVSFRYQKYREEFSAEEVTLTIDETPIGTFVEIEGGERGILAMARTLGRAPADFLLDSYRGLFLRHCDEQGIAATDMVFDEDVVEG
ncbi:MAG: class IV adenylate cyclase [Acidimicrobiia bacterium]|nr:class IV adenylate cyclase [Acidimicrobiia bacterium]